MSSSTRQILKAKVSTYLGRVVLIEGQWLVLSEDSWTAEGRRMEVQSEMRSMQLVSAMITGGSAFLAVPSLSGQ